MRDELIKLLRGILKHPATSIVVGIALVVVGICDAYETVFEDFIGVDVGVHHGLIMFGSIKVLEALLLVLEGTESLVLEEEIEEAGIS